MGDVVAKWDEEVVHAPNVKITFGVIQQHRRVVKDVSATRRDLLANSVTATMVPVFAYLDLEAISANECARGYTGTWPFCQPCGECFHQWDSIIQGLKAQVDKLIDTAANIEDTGVASAYDEEFESMEAKLEETKKKLSDANISKEHIEQLENEVAKLKKEVGAAREKLDGIEARVSNATQAVDFAEEDLKQLQADAVRLTEAADDLRDRTNKIKEADVQGAYNITRESAARSLAAQRRTDAAIGKLAEAESEARDAEALLEKNRDDFDKQYAENEAALAESEQKLHMLEAALPTLKCRSLWSCICSL
ncbi:hypothetical protein COOONC_09370 [Cooperia oncophora]